MYYTEINPFSGEKIFVEKEQGRKDRQKQIVVAKRKFQADTHNRRKKHKWSKSPKRRG
jgi:hypothetical protein